jgi:integrase
MARTVLDSQLDSRTARARLQTRVKPYFRAIDPGLHLAYRRNTTGGTWNVRMYLGGGKYQMALLGTADDWGEADGSTVLNFSQAQAAARDRYARATRSANGLPEPSVGPYTVDDALDDYLTWLDGEGRGEKNIADVKAKAKTHIRPKLGNVRLDRLTAKQISDWLHALAKAPPRLRSKAGKRIRHRQVNMSDPEVKRARRSAANKVFGGVLKPALNKAWRDHKVVDDKPWRSVKPFRNVTASRARYLQLDECRRLLNTANDGDDFRDMVEAGLYSGARWSELCRLNPGDFNRDAGTLVVHLSKSGKARHIVLTEEGTRFFVQAVAKARDRDCLFVRSDGEPWKTSWQIRAMKAACARANIKPNAGFHILRHTWASHSVMNGTPLLLVARNLGHRDERMVVLHYGHLAPSYETDAIRAGAPRFGMGDSTVLPLRQH